eukprot:15358719-Ditylum_brightwellii.AAC.1
MQRGIMARQLMQNGEKHQYFDDNQYSGRNGCNAVDVELGKSFTMGTFHLQCTNTAGCMDNNAKACYGCIIPIILLLTYVKVDLLYATAVFFSHILYNMKYHLTTIFGISPLVNYFGLLAAVFGISQGSTDGPPGWACISDIILKYYHRLCKGCTIHDPGGLITVKCNADMFVDDSTLMHNSPEIDIPLQKLMENIQYDFEPSRRPCIVPESKLPTNTVRVTDAHGNTTLLTRVSTMKVIRMLGIYKAATLDETAEFDYLMDCTMTYVQATSAYPLKPHKAWIGYKPCTNLVLHILSVQHLLMITKWINYTLLYYLASFPDWAINRCSHMQ